MNESRAPHLEVAAAARRILGFLEPSSVLDQLCREACSVSGATRALASHVPPGEPWSAGVHIERRLDALAGEARSDGAHDRSDGAHETPSEDALLALESLYRRLSETQELEIVQGHAEEHVPLFRALSRRGATTVQRIHGVPIASERRVHGVLALPSAGELEPETLEVLRFLCECAATALCNSERVVKTAERLTERCRRVERELASERALLHTIFMNAPVCICVLRGPDHVVDRVNPTYVQLVGGSEHPGLPVRSVLPELEEQGYIDLLDRVYRTGEAASGTEMLARFRQADGTVKDVYFDFAYQPVRGEDGGMLGVIAFGFDVTEQVLARRRLEHALADLRDAVATRDEFLSIASHELKTPLTPLQLQLDSLRLLLDKEGALDERAARKLEQASRQTARLTRLVENLLDVSRITRFRLELEIEEVDLGELIREIASRYADEAHRAGCTLEIHAPSPVVGRWDRMRLEQVISILVSNAIKYGPGKPVEIRAEARDDAARLTVRDYGIGIAQADLSRIFERFERAVSARHYGGLGLGLYIARQIVDAHSGSIGVSSEPGAGATFTVVIPLEPKPASGLVRAERSPENGEVS
ncbi:MAG: ATP-binding protein [Pseudomonadota bacterium]